MPDNGAVNCEADNYLVENYDRAADARNKQAASLAANEKKLASDTSDLAKASLSMIKRPPTTSDWIFNN